MPIVDRKNRDSWRRPRGGRAAAGKPPSSAWSPAESKDSRRLTLRLPQWPFYAGAAFGGAWTVWSLVADGAPAFRWISVAVGAYIFLWSSLMILRRSHELNIGDDGFRLRRIIRHQDYLWSDVSAFRVEEKRVRKRYVDRVAFDARGVKMTLADQMFARLGARARRWLPGNYGMSAEELAKTMNSWRERAQAREPFRDE